MKATNKKSSGSIKIDPETLKEAKKICIDLEVNVGDYATSAIKEKNIKESNKLNKNK